MSIFDQQGQWFPFSSDLWRDPKTQPQKLRLCADASVPRPLIDGIRSMKVSIRTAAEDGVAARPDAEVVEWAKREGRLLLTMDRDFWDDRRYPIHAAGGILYIAVPGHDIDASLDAFKLFYCVFGRTFAPGEWSDIKIRATPQGFIQKLRGLDGQTVRLAVKLDRSGPVALDLDDTLLPLDE